MKSEFFIAHRLYYDPDNRRRRSRPAVRVALAGIIIGVMVMILTICVVVGFKRTITSKVACFGGHIQVTNFDNNSTYEMKPVVISDSLLDLLRNTPNIDRVQRFLTKPGILKTDDNFQGIILKGIDDFAPFAPNLLSGRVPEKENEIMVSDLVCRQLGLTLDARVLSYFVGDDVRVRRFSVVGIYATGFQEADQLFVWCQSSVIRRLNGWDEDQVSGVELTVHDISDLELTADDIWCITANHLDEDGNSLYTQTLEQLNPQIFAWLDLLDMNVIVIIILMLCVSGFNIVSGLIILIMDSVQLIGTLKAMGANNRFVRRIFIVEAFLLIGRGVLWGNLLGLGLAAMQYFTHVFSLDASTYYVNYVPIAFPWLLLIGLNIGVVLVSWLILLAPSAIITRISPAQVMRFE